MRLHIKQKVENPNFDRKWHFKNKEILPSENPGQMKFPVRVMNPRLNK